MTDRNVRLSRTGTQHLAGLSLLDTLFRNAATKGILRLSAGSKTIARSACIVASAICMALPTGALADASTLKAAFNATCASGLHDAHDLAKSLGDHGFQAASTSHSYGHFTGPNAGEVAGYHIVSGSWSCFVAGPASATIDTCHAAQELGAIVLARFADGACLAARADDGLQFQIRTACADASDGRCLWLQASMTRDSGCYSPQDNMQLSSLPMPMRDLR